MRYVYLLFIVFLNPCFAQEQTNLIYFPQEQLIHPKCVDSVNKNACLEAKIQKELVFVLRNALKEIKVTKDTIKASVSFEVDRKGFLVVGSDRTYVNDSTLRKDFKEDLKSITENLPRFDILNRKPKPYASTHSLSYVFLTQNVKGVSEPILLMGPNTNKYSGGYIQEIPLFPDCKRGNEQKARLCFQKKMQNHISHNFRNPKVALKKGLQGKVDIIFVINKEGIIENLRVKAPYKPLEDEAIRIIKLLPKLEPGLRNGKPVRVPYSIPITFRL